MAGPIGLGQILRMGAKGPALSARERAAFAEPEPSGAAYCGEPLAPGPVPPLIPFAAGYDLDLVLVSDHPSWNMHEYARIDTADGPIWLAKDSREGSLDQCLVVDVAADRLASLLPEVPLIRKASPVRVDDRSEGDRVDLDLRYENIDGDAVHVHYEGRVPHSLQRKRNGSTMGHSRNQVLAVLDLSHRDFAKKASITIAGQRRRLRLFGLLALALKQVQGGFAVGRVRSEGGAATFGSGAAIHWTPSPWERGTRLQTEDRIRGVELDFLDVDGAHELSAVTVVQAGRDVPTMHARFVPAIPDLARPFEGVRAGRFAVDVNGQEGHAVGGFEARWRGDEALLDLRPEAPSWVAERPMHSTLRFADGAVELEAAMGASAPASGSAP